MEQFSYTRLDMEDVDRLDARDVDIKVPGGTDLPLVQFMEGIGVVGSGDETGHEVTVMRIGNLRTQSTVRYKTIDGSAKVGEQFEHAEGQLVFNDGDEIQSFNVRLVNDPSWNAAKEFKILLHDEFGCYVEPHLREKRVTVYDTDVFPNSDFQEQVEAGDIQNINLWVLFHAFNQLLLDVKGIKWRAYLTVCMGFLKNAYEYMCLILQIYIVDKIFNFESDEGLLVPGSRLQTAYVVAALIFIPKLLFFVADHAEISMDIGGILRKELSESLFRTFTNYGANSRREVSMSEMTLTLTSDIGDVTYGFMRSLGMIRLMGQIAIAIFFTLSHNPGCWWAIVVVPVVMLGWGLLRVGVTIDASDVSGDSMNDLTTFVNETLSKVGLIIDYKQRPMMNDLFMRKTQEFKDVRIPEKRINVNNMAVPKLMGPAMVSLYTAIGAALVLNKSLKLGTYLATIRAFGNICSDFVDFYSLVMEIIGTFPALRGLTDLLNKEVDLVAAETTNALRKRLTHERRIALPKHPNIPRIDQLNIELTEVSFHFDVTDATGETQQVKLFDKISLVCPQGKLVAVLSNAGSGRKTFLELLSGKRYPDSGTIFIPSYLRVLLITREVVLLNLSLWANLTFGNKNSNPYQIEEVLHYFVMEDVLSDGHFMRKLRALKRDFLAGLSATELDAVRASYTNYSTTDHDGSDESVEEEETPQIGIMDSMSEGEKALIHLSRGFIANPEVLLVHRPFSHFYRKETIELVQEAFRQTRDHRGFLCTNGPEIERKRRPRTIIMTPDRSETVVEIADLIWYLPGISSGGDSRPVKEYSHYNELSTTQRFSYIGLNPPTRERSDMKSLREVAQNEENQHQVASSNVIRDNSSDRLWPLRKQRSFKVQQKQVSASTLRPSMEYKNVMAEENSAHTL